jgi:hypothetical protein
VGGVSQVRSSALQDFVIAFYGYWLSPLSKFQNLTVGRLEIVDAGVALIGRAVSLAEHVIAGNSG